MQSPRLVFVFSVLVLFGAAVPTAQAHDVWSDPFPGVRRLQRDSNNQNINVLVIDLCAAGVGVRATATGERGRTVPSFGQAVGAQAAINGDFFGGGYSTDGLSMSGGAAWPGEADHTYVAPLIFGPRRVELPHHGNVTSIEPWMQEIVSGHPTLLDDGNVVGNPGDSLCTNRHPRTAAGLSADGRTLFLAVIDGRATTRIGMTCNETAALFTELGAHDAVNLDGGGSSTMWLAGSGVANRPSDGSPRTVGNHLAIYASGSGDAPFCPNRAPIGNLDGSDCKNITGWTQDGDVPESSVDVHLYFDGPAGAENSFGIAVPADAHRDDLCEAIGSCAHGFSFAPPPVVRDGLEHEVYAYGIDSEGGPATLLAGSPQRFTCAPPTPPTDTEHGRLRHIVSGESLGAWAFQRYDIAPITDDHLAEYQEATSWPDAPRLVRSVGESAVYLVDGTRLRHVTSVEAMTAWRFSFDAVEELSAEELGAWTVGPALPSAPFLAQGSGPEVYLFDSEMPDSELPPTGETDDVVSGCAASSPAPVGFVGALLLVGLLSRLRRRGRDETN